MVWSPRQIISVRGFPRDVIDIAMIPVTYDPMEGVVFDVQEYARQIGTMLDRYTWGDDLFIPPWG
jgi:hypothetical protein